MADECYGKRDGCVHGEQNSFGRARFLLTPSLVRATVRVWRWACDVHCILQLQFTFPSFLPSFERKMRYRSWGSNVVMGCQYNYSLIGSFFEHMFTARGSRIRCAAWLRFRYTARSYRAIALSVIQVIVRCTTKASNALASSLKNFFLEPYRTLPLVREVSLRNKQAKDEKKEAKKESKWDWKVCLRW